MGHRHIIVVTGKGGPGYDHHTVRLYGHWGSDPATAFKLILGATARAERYRLDNADYLRIFSKDGKTSPDFVDVPAKCLADFIIAESIGWSGAGLEVDEDYHRDRDGETNYDRRINSSWPEAVSAKSFGEQSDLDYSYLVHIPGREVRVYAGNPALDQVTSCDDYRLWPVIDPRDASKDLMEEYQGESLMEITCRIDQLLEAGWKVKMPEPKKSKRKRGVRA